MTAPPVRLDPDVPWRVHFQRMLEVGGSYPRPLRYLRRWSMARAVIAAGWGE